MFRGLFLAPLLALTLSLSGHSSALAADPSPAASPPSSPILIDPLDPRAGEGASRVGAPFLALVFVVAVGALTVVATLVLVRAGRRA